MEASMPTTEVTAGTIEYEDTGGAGPVVVLLHGLGTDGSLWRKVVPELRGEHRVIVPTLPLGGHRIPMLPGADLTSRGLARLEAEFLEALGLHDVTLVGNDSGLYLFAAARARHRIARLVVTSCEAFENYPPGLPGRALWYAARVPGGADLAVQALRVRALRRSPFLLGRMTRRPIPHEVTDRWFRGLIADPRIRRDLFVHLRSARRDDMFHAALGLRGFDRPALVVWAREDRTMPPEHGRRLAALLPRARLVEIADSGTFLPEDQPRELALAIREFVRESTV
jgi:pimeloyl-ACP methyl ester carboxylesterase